MSQPCAIDNCKRASRALCHCCQQNICLPHLTEHNDQLNSQLYPLADEINTLGERLKTLNIEDIVGNCRQKLEQWRDNSHKKIDRFYKQKSQEFDDLVTNKLDKPRKTITEIRSKVADLIRDQEATRKDINTLTSTINDVKDSMDKANRTCFEVEIHPLLINDSTVQFKEKCGQEFNPSCLDTVSKRIACPKGSYRALAANDRYLLIHQNPHLSFVDVKLTVVKQVVWPHYLIEDMTWSSMLDRFIVATDNTIYLVDETTMSINSVPTIGQRSWFSCTCSDDRLFLSTNAWGSSIVEISLSPSIAVTKEWKSPITCTMDEWVHDIVYNNGTLATIITNKVEKSIRMELRSSKTMDRLWSLPLDVIYSGGTPFHYCSWKCNTWMVADFSNGRLLHITLDGKMKKTIAYKDDPYYITLFGPNLLAVSVANNVNLHKISR